MLRGKRTYEEEFEEDEEERKRIAILLAGYLILNENAVNKIAFLKDYDYGDLGIHEFSEARFLQMFRCLLASPSSLSTQLRK